MDKNVIKRIALLERNTQVGLPPVLHINGAQSPPTLWNKGFTKAQAEAQNNYIRELRAALGDALGT